MEKLNIAELLKDCPTGMELDCTMYDNVTLIQVQEDNTYPIKIETPDGSTVLTKYGGVSYNELSKCIIFPKGKTTWEGFHKPFEDGDVVISDHGDIHISKDNSSSYCCKRQNYFDATITTHVKFDRLATEEEKQKLFDAIKDNGYKWNAETKTLERSIEPKFKDGDILFVKATYSWIIIYKESENDGRLYKYVGIPMGIPDYPDYTFMVYDCNPLCCKDDISEIRLATEEEKKKLFDAIKENGYRWNPETKILEKLPKFKAGDKVAKKCNMSNPVSIIRVGDQYYYHYSNTEHDVEVLPIAEQDDWELVPNKFNINTLVPFESKVLVRDINSDNWIGAFYSHYKPGRFYTIGNSYYYQCIPYEGNEHLLGKTGDCDEFYKTWE